MAKTLDDQIKDAKEALQELEDLKNLSPEVQEIAILLHDLCQYSHTDQCGWEYEITNGVHDWSGNTHKTYVKLARKAMDVASIDKIKYIITIKRAPILFALELERKIK
jgi:hypothetical protein